MKAVKASVIDLFKGIIRITKTYAQVVLVFLAFTIMVVLSCIFMIKMEFQHLRKEAMITLSNAQMNIAANLHKSENTLENISEIVRMMVMSGESTEMVKKYIKEVFGGEFYSEAESRGKATGDELRYDNELGSAVVTYVRNILDNSGYRLGIICLDVNLDDILKKYVVSLKITENGYGMLLNKKLKIVAHPNNEFLGESLLDPNIPLSIFEYELVHGQDVFERELVNYEGKEMVSFFKRLENGWYLGAATPEKEYYKNVMKIAEILSIMAFVLALLLCIILVRIIKMRNKAERQAKDASRAKSVFLARMSNEIRTPMNAILGLTEIELQKTDLDYHEREVFTSIYNSSHLLLGIINNVLDLSKIEAGKITITNINYKLTNLISDVVQLNAMRNSKQVELEVHVEEDLPECLIGDEIRIKQILNNILSNAFKYTKQGRVRFSVSYEVGLNDSEVIIVFCVSDTGIGMTREQASNLFTEYARFNLEANRYIEGSGLGMNITKHLLQMMNGRIAVNSTFGKGTVFTVHLPQKFEGSARIGREKASEIIIKPTQLLSKHSLSQK